MRVRNKTLPAILSQTGLGVALKAVVPQPAVSLRPRLRRRNCGVSQDSGGILTRKNAVGPHRRNPVLLERAAQRHHLIEANDSFYWRFRHLARIFIHALAIRPVFSCSQTTGGTQNRFRPDLLTKYKCFDATLTPQAGFAGPNPGLLG